MAEAERIALDWSTAEIRDGALEVRLTGAGSKDWRKRFDAVSAALGREGSGWGAIRPSKHAIAVESVARGAEEDLRHHLESCVMQVNSDLAPAREEEQAEKAEGAEPNRDEVMTATFRGFAERESARRDPQPS